jgi:hypothetical protein
MHIHAHPPLQSNTADLWPSQVRLSQPPARTDASPLQGTATGDTSDLSDKQSTALKQSLGSDSQPIEDATAADAAMNYAANTIRQQPGTALLVQANQLPETVLDLLQ